MNPPPVGTPPPVITGNLENITLDNEIIFPNPSDTSFQLKTNGAFSYLLGTSAIFLIKAKSLKLQKNADLP